MATAASLEPPTAVKPAIAPTKSTSTVMEAATAVEAMVTAEAFVLKPAIAPTKSTSTVMEAATAVEATVTAEAFVLKPATAAKAPVYEDPFVKAWAAIKTTTVVAVTSIIAMKPRPRADENTADEVVGAVIAIGSAGIRVITIVAISADRSRPYIRRANSNTDNHSLCVGERCRT